MLLFDITLLAEHYRSSEGAAAGNIVLAVPP